MNLYIVESPLQVICAYEAILENKHNNYKLYVRLTGRGKNDSHTIACVEYFNLEYKSFKLYPDSLQKHLFYNMFLWFYLAVQKFDFVYFGSIFSKGLKFLRKIITCKNVFYLDDGAATLRAHSLMSENKLEVEDLFTFFKIEELKNQNIIVHSFEKLKKNMTDKSYEKAYFIGQPFEHMLGYTESKYLNCVNEIAKLYSKENPLIYIPHRIENINVLSAIENIQILKLDMPIELYFVAYSKSAPLEIFSCYSSALITLKELYSDVQVVSIKCQKNIMPELNPVYSYFESINIKVITID